MGHLVNALCVNLSSKQRTSLARTCDSASWSVCLMFELSETPLKCQRKIAVVVDIFIITEFGTYSVEKTVYTHVKNIFLTRKNFLKNI
jgi:hypothetical protein